MAVINNNVIKDHISDNFIKDHISDNIIKDYITDYNKNNKNNLILISKTT